jgi:hypothetical protein
MGYSRRALLLYSTYCGLCNQWHRRRTQWFRLSVRGAAAQSAFRPWHALDRFGKTYPSATRASAQGSATSIRVVCSDWRGWAGPPPIQTGDRGMHGRNVRRRPLLHGCKNDWRFSEALQRNPRLGPTGQRYCAGSTPGPPPGRRVSNYFLVKDRTEFREPPSNH